MSTWWCIDEAGPELDIKNVDALWNTDWGVIQPRHYEALGCYVFYPKPQLKTTPVAHPSQNERQAENGTPFAGRTFVSLSEQVPPPVNDGVKDDAADVACTPCDPADVMDQELPSLGSEGHANGTCKRCTFFPKGRCSNGFDCTFCHFPHDPRKRHRRRRTGTQSTAIPTDCAEQDVGSDCGEEAAPVLTAVQRSAMKNDDRDSADIETAAPSSGVQTSDSETRSVGGGDYSDSDTCRTPPTSPELTFAPPSAMTTGSKRSQRMKRSGSEGQEMQSTNEALIAKRVSPLNWEEVTKDWEQGTDSTVSRDEPAEFAEATTDDSSDDGGSSPTSVTRRARSILNKLSADNFERLYLQLMALPFHTPEHLSALVFEIFQTATVQRGFLSLYSELCSRVDSYFADEAADGTGGKAFRKALVNECQASFERNLRDQGLNATTDLPAEERYEAEMKFKEQMLGNMRFIGELLTRRLLASKLLIPILNELMTHGSEAALESLVALLAVVAPHFEKGSPLCAAPLKDAFATLKTRSTDKKISSRVRFLFKDLLEARKRGWAAKGVA